MDKYTDLNLQTYDWCVRLFDRVKNLLKVRFRLHHQNQQLINGDIFLFNHFARAETFIPQYLIYHHNGGYCRSVAAAAFFKNDNRISRLLLDLGVVPNNHPNLMLMLATDVLRGRKIVIFPEGGMVKDRQVIDSNGRYSVYSRAAQTRRRHHTGAARLAIGLQIIKSAIVQQHSQGNREFLEKWATELHLPSVDALLEQAHRPVGIVPANITFYPLRVNENFLSRTAEKIYKDLPQRTVEELVVEGNLFFKETDMDIRLGDTIVPTESWQWWEAYCARRLAHTLRHPNDIFELEFLHRNVIRKTLTRGLNKSINRLRDSYMEDIYQEVTVNLSHVGARIIIGLIDKGLQTIPKDTFQLMIYHVVKLIQPNTNVHLHRSLINPAIYRKLLTEDSDELNRFLRSASSAALVEIESGEISFLPKLVAEHEFDMVRLENPIEVYANEIAPVEPVCVAIDEVLANEHQYRLAPTGELHFDDELRRHTWDKVRFQQPEHDEINNLQTASENPEPFLLQAKRNDIAVLLTHGFLASPAEMRGLADTIHSQGITVMGTRLRGHGTSPWDLRERNWEDWLESVESGCDILGKLAERVLLVGFSTGGTLSLVAAANGNPMIAGVCCVCAPMKFRNKNMRFVPLMYGANKVVRWLSKYEGVMPFRPTEPEHPHINYRHMPIRGLYELTRLVGHTKSSLSKIDCPVTIVQSEEDHVVEPTSANIIYDSLLTERKHLHWVPSKKHGIVYGNIGNTHQIIGEFVQSFRA